MKELRAIYSHGFNLDLGDGTVKNNKVMTDFNFPCLDRVVRCQTSGNKYQTGSKCMVKQFFKND